MHIYKDLGKNLYIQIGRKFNITIYLFNIDNYG